MPPSRKELKLDDLEPPPPNQLALANARSESDTARSQAQAVVGGKREPLDPPEKRINMLYKLPMDVVYEVFSHLHPRDLLTLARTSKRLRAFLTRRNCAFVWRASRALVGLLDPTKSLCMSEPAFANLLFSDHCHGCGMVSDDIMWPVPVRYCDGCRKINFGPATDRVKAIAWAAGFGLSDVVLFAHTTMKDVQIWHLPQLDEIEAKFKLVTLQDVNEKRRYVQAHMDYVAVWNEYMPTLFAWLQDYEDKLRTEDEVLQRKRCVAAMAKLRTMEWDREVDMLSPDDLDQLASLKSLTLESPLSDEDWGRIESNVMRFMSSPPEAFHSRKYSGTQLCWRMCLVERALRQYRHSKGTTGAALERASGLRFGDLAAMPNVRALLEDESPDLTREAFLDRLADMIPSLLVDWHKECKSYLISLAEDELQKAGMPLPEEPLTLDLAIMSFQCEDCAFESPLRWPEVLGHTCLRYVDQDDHPPPKGRVYETEVWRYLDLLGWDQAKWDPVPRRGKRALPKRTLSLDESLRSALAVITACGLDPKTATKEEMDEKGARFVCGFCSEGRSTREVYDWIGAIQHDLDNVWHSQNDQWIRLPDDLAVRARGVGPAVQNTEYICTWCYSSSTISSIRQHVQLHHEQENPKEGEDYYCQKTMCCIVTMFTENHMQDPDAQEQVRAGTAFFARF